MCVVEEDEYIAAVSGSILFTNTAYAINPGNATTFPWLSVQAKQWEKYHFDYLEFYYKREVSEFATNGTTGKIILAVDFDASDSPPVSKVQIEDTDPRTDGMPCSNLRLPLKAGDIHALFKELYVRSGGLPGSSDIKTYDAGNLNVATQGCIDATEIGELRVKYRVTFKVPVLDSTTSAPKNNSVALFRSAVGTPAGLVTTTVTILPLATEVYNGLGAVNTAGSIVLPAGNYLVDFNAEINFTGSSTACQAEIYKDGVAINGNVQNNTYVAAQLTNTSITVSSLFVSNGSNVLTCQQAATFSTGAANPGGVLRIVAI